jgi:hypothetical protein
LTAALSCAATNDWCYLQPLVKICGIYSKLSSQFQLASVGLLYDLCLLSCNTCYLALAICLCPITALCPSDYAHCPKQRWRLPIVCAVLSCDWPFAWNFFFALSPSCTSDCVLCPNTVDALQAAHLASCSHGWGRKLHPAALSRQQGQEVVIQALRLPLTHSPRYATSTACLPL